MGIMLAQVEMVLEPQTGERALYLSGAPWTLWMWVFVIFAVVLTASIGHWVGVPLAFFIVFAVSVIWTPLLLPAVTFLAGSIFGILVGALCLYALLYMLFGQP
jgi:hypothetical protein